MAGLGSSCSILPWSLVVADIDLHDEFQTIAHQPYAIAIPADFSEQRHGVLGESENQSNRLAAIGCGEVRLLTVLPDFEPDGEGPRRQRHAQSLASLQLLEFVGRYFASERMLGKLEIHDWVSSCHSCWVLKFRINPAAPSGRAMGLIACKARSSRTEGAWLGRYGGTK